MAIDPIPRLPLDANGAMALTGAASGIGAATAARLKAAGHRVITVDLHGADVTCDLATEAGSRFRADHWLAVWNRPARLVHRQVGSLRRGAA